MLGPPCWAPKPSCAEQRDRTIMCLADSQCLGGAELSKLSIVPFDADTAGTMSAETFAQP